MHVEFWTGPPVETHAYLVADREAGEAWAIDAPLSTAEALLTRTRALGLRLTRLILTHGHFDHFLDAARYDASGIPIALHSADIPLLRFPQTMMFGVDLPMPQFSVREDLTEGGRLALGRFHWDVWHVPGHSPGHVVLHCPEQAVLLGGDLLFRGGYGRVDLPHSDPAAMAQSLLRLLDLPDRTAVFPGHGPQLTLGEERTWLEPLLSDPRGVSL